MAGPAPQWGATLEFPARWPGWSPAGTLLLAVDAAHWPPPSTALCHAGREFAPKRELHVTVVGRDLGAALGIALVQGRLDPEGLRADFERQRWRLRRNGLRIHLRKATAGDAPAIESIIEPVALPAMARFHARLARRLGRALPVPPPHVTLYVLGGADGIGVPDPLALERLRVGPAWRADAG